MDPSVPAADDPDVLAVLAADAALAGPPMCLVASWLSMPTDQLNPEVACLHSSDRGGQSFHSAQ